MFPLLLLDSNSILQCFLQHWTGVVCVMKEDEPRFGTAHTRQGNEGWTSFIHLGSFSQYIFIAHLVCARHCCRCWEYSSKKTGMSPCDAKNYNLVLVKQLVMDKDRPTEMTSPCSQVPPGADNPEQALSGVLDKAVCMTNIQELSVTKKPTQFRVACEIDL